MLRANGTGLQQYTAKISTINNEFSVKNNEMNFYVEVIDGRQKILLAHQSPHPDVAAVRFVIENNKNYQTEVKYFKEISSVNEYDLVIVHSYQSGNSVLDEEIKQAQFQCSYERYWHRYTQFAKPSGWFQRKRKFDRRNRFCIQCSVQRYFAFSKNGKYDQFSATLACAFWKSELQQSN